MDPLDVLAKRAGIEDRFREATGEWHDTPPDTKRALLEAMGLRTGTEEEAAAALTCFEEQEWLRALPPVRVAYNGEGRIDLRAVVPRGTSSLQWTLELENGEQRSGTAELTETTRMEQRDLRQGMLDAHLLRLQGGFPHGYHQ
ncbi:MAG: putative 4-alpha-glucanotransferase, partial [Bryobacterales bacterium]|nr:putative 4-alpha-glucanotransferase [Bryobacterales bacterium]